MGLDMYAYSNIDGESTEIAYWRKVNWLHGWMEQLYYDNGGTAESFNCVDVDLTPEDIDRLEDDLNNDRLKPVTGFFFGAQEIYPEDVETTREFIENAREEFKLGAKVFYTSWW